MKTEQVKMLSAETFGYDRVAVANPRKSLIKSVEPCVIRFGGSCSKDGLLQFLWNLVQNASVAFMLDVPCLHYISKGAA